MVFVFARMVTAPAEDAVVAFSRTTTAPAEDAAVVFKRIVASAEDAALNGINPLKEEETTFFF